MPTCHPASGPGASRRPMRLVGASLAAILGSGVVAAACPVGPPGIAVGEARCTPAGAQTPPWDGAGDDLRIASSPGATGTLTLSAGDKVVLSPGADADPALAAPFAAVGRADGSFGTLNIGGAGAELAVDAQGRSAALHPGRDGGRGAAVVADGGANRMLSVAALAFGPDQSIAGIAVGRAEAGTVGELTLDAGTVDIDTRGSGSAATAPRAP